MLLLLASISAHGAPRSQPTLRLKLSDLGVPNVPQYLQGSGACMLTAHFVDNTHLLITYSLRGLVERIPGDPPTDEDRAVAGILVELPSGKVLARTRWHLHDYGQYLWSLGGGRFLIRTRSTLTAIAPLANLESGEAFRGMPFMHVPDVLDAIQVSPEGDMVTVESSPPRKRPEPPPASAAGVITLPPVDAVKEPLPVGTVFFARVAGTGSPESPVRAIAAGAVKVRGPGLVPLNSRGYLFAKSGKRSRWTLQFDGYDGELRDLSYVDSSCAPRMQFISPSQFLVFSCRGSDDRLMISAFDFMPQEMWEEPLSGISTGTQFAYAPQAGRFAISRTVPAPSTPSTPPGPGQVASTVSEPVTAQEVRIYQMQSGDLLAKLLCQPVSTSGQNFDLAADGLSALAVRNGAIEVFPLAPPSPRDLKELAEVRLHEPTVPHATNVQLRHLLKEAVEAEARAEQHEADKEALAAEAAKPKPAEPSATVAPPAAAPPAPDVSANAPANVGDVDTPRKPPSLLNPGETTDDGKKQPKH